MFYSSNDCNSDIIIIKKWSKNCKTKKRSTEIIVTDITEIYQS